MLLSGAIPAPVIISDGQPFAESADCATFSQLPGRHSVDSRLPDGVPPPGASLAPARPSPEAPAADPAGPADAADSPADAAHRLDWGRGWRG